MDQTQPPRIMGLPLMPVILALSFFAASLTPSLIPRPWGMQGILGGLVMGIGFAIGQLARAIWGWLALPRLYGRWAVRLQMVVGIAVAILLIRTLVLNSTWQNQIRALLQMLPTEEAHTFGVVALAMVVFAVTVVIGMAVQRLFNLARFALYRLMPAQTANVMALIAVIIAIFTITNRGIVDPAFSAVDAIFQTAQNLTEPEADTPTKDWRVGSTGSGIDWASMGKPGRDFVRLGPDAQAISELTGRPAQNPIRVYVGRAQDPDPQTRARIALDELIRLRAFERSVLIMASPTGTGWLDPGSHDPVEYLHDGDIATVAVQYSHLQSPVALVFETTSGLDQAQATVRTVYNYWKTLPDDARPALYIHGLSLGAWSSMSAFNILQILNDPINGALWAGPPFPSQLWQQINDNREPGSPYVQPIIGDGNLVRYASQFGGLDDAAAPWGDMRLVFLQYASDPIVFFETGSAFVAPQWMREPAAPDVWPDLTFTPFVTQLQLALDMAIATSVPKGYGHNYAAADYIDAWVAVTKPEGWSEAQIESLKGNCGGDWGLGCR